MKGGKKQVDLKNIQTPVLYMKSYNKLFNEPELYLLILYREAQCKAMGLRRAGKVEELWGKEDLAA